MGYLKAFLRWVTGGNWTVHCWHDPREEDLMADGASCLLLLDHLGPHHHIPDGDISVEFT